MKISHLLLWAIVLTAPTGCQRRIAEKDKYIVEFLSRPVRFDHTYSPDRAADSLLFGTKPKLIHYVDSSGCISCKFSDLKLWSVVHKHFRIPVVLVCETQDIPSTRYRLQSINWRFPVVYDTAGLFRTNNRISTPVLQTFLLDSGNHPLIVGNPIGNTQLWHLYEKEIARLTDIRER